MIFEPITSIRNGGEQGAGEPLGIGQQGLAVSFYLDAPMPGDQRGKTLHAAPVGGDLGAQVCTAFPGRARVAQDEVPDSLLDAAGLYQLYRGNDQALLD